MYNKAGTAVAAGATSGGLAMTGFNAMWVLLAGFAMLAVGSALLRIIPRARSRH